MINFHNRNFPRCCVTSLQHFVYIEDLLCVCMCPCMWRPNFQLCVPCVYIMSTCDNILLFLLVEIFMRSPHLSMQFKQRRLAVLSHFSRRSHSPGGPFHTRRSIVSAAHPSPLPCSNVCLLLWSDINFLSPTPGAWRYLFLASKELFQGSCDL